MKIFAYLIYFSTGFSGPCAQHNDYIKRNFSPKNLANIFVPKVQDFQRIPLTVSLYQLQTIEFLKSVLPTAIMPKFNADMDIVNAWKETANIFRLNLFRRLLTEQNFFRELDKNMPLLVSPIVVKREVGLL